MSATEKKPTPGKQEPLRHVHIHPECSLCGCYFDVGDRLFALIGDRFRSSCQVVDATTFPMAIYCNQRHGTQWIFCQFPKCSKCSAEQESATVHRDCFQIFLRETAAHEHITSYNLWHAAHARYPWRGFWPLPQTTIGPKAADLAMLHATASWHMPLDALPYELSLMICENLRYSAFWRYILAKEFTRNLIANADISSAPTTTLSRVKSWKRGSLPDIGELEAAENAFLRLTTDALGLCEIERLAGMPEKSTQRSESYAYVVDRAERLGQITVSFKFGTGRLYPPKGLRSLRSWDTPGPPIPPNYDFPADLQPICPRLGTIETEKSFGITFFISSGQIAGIHAHTVLSPSAYPCFQRLNPVKKRWVAWIFVPIHGGIEKFGYRTPLLPPGATLPPFAGTLLLRMKIAGEVVLGPYMPYGKDIWMEDDASTLVHGISRMGAVYPMGLAPRSEQGEDDGVVYENPMNLSPPFEHAYFSVAELDNVVSIEVYHDQILGICRGVNVQYESGGERALGQCRVGVDSVSTYAKPMWFCFKKTTYLRPGTRVERDSIKIECHAGAKHHHQQDGWSCCQFPSRLEWWFTSEETRISFTPRHEDGLDGVSEYLANVALATS